MIVPVTRTPPKPPPPPPNPPAAVAAPAPVAPAPPPNALRSELRDVPSEELAALVALW